VRYLGEMRGVSFSVAAVLVGAACGHRVDSVDGGEWNDAAGDAAQPDSGREAPLELTRFPSGRVSRLSLLDGDVYWVDDGLEATGDSQIGRISVQGGDQELLAVGLPSAAGFVVREGTAYWADRLGGIIRLHLDEPSLPEELFNDGFGPLGIALDDMGYVYWTTAIAPTGRVARISEQGGEPVVLADDLSSPIAIEVVEDNVYFGDYAGLKSVPVKGGGTLVLDDRVNPAGIKWDGVHLYWRAGGDSDYAVLRSTLPKFVAETVALVNHGSAFAVDAEYVYYTEDEDGVGDGRIETLYRAANDGSGERQVMYEGLSAIYGLALDDRYLYATTGDTILKLEK
jgi:hypothetical protein